MTAVADPAGPASPGFPWSAVRGVLSFVGLAIALVAVDCSINLESREVDVVASAGAAGMVSFGAMRRPWFSLALVLLYMILGPGIANHGANHPLYAACLVLAWPPGAAAGWAIRRAGRGPSRRAAEVSPGSGRGAVKVLFAALAAAGFVWLAVDDSLAHGLLAGCLVLAWPLGAVARWAIRRADHRRAAGMSPDQGGLP